MLPGRVCRLDTFPPLAAGAAAIRARARFARRGRRRPTIPPASGNAGARVYRRWIHDLGRLLPELIVETDAHGTILLVNEGAQPTAPDGRHGPLEGTPVAQFVPPGQRAAFLALLESARVANLPATAEFDLAPEGQAAAPARVVVAPIGHGFHGERRGLRCVFTDLSSERQSRAQLDHQRTASAAITDVLRTISAATEGEMDEALARSLVAIGGLATIDRCFVGRLLGDGQELHWEFTWAAAGVEPVTADRLPSCLSQLPWLQEQVSAGHIVHIEDVAAMPPAAAQVKERLLRQETRSALVIPMFHDGHIAGLFAFHSVRSVGAWTDEDVALLETVGQILANAWQRRQADQERAAAHRRLADTIEFLPDATFVVDDRGSIVAWNRALEDLTGVPKRDMLGHGDRAYASVLIGGDEPDLVDVILAGGRADVAMPAGRGQGETLRAERFLAGLRHGQGAHVWLTATPLRDGAGRVVGAIETLRDVTERKRAEQALRRSEERVRLLNEHLERRVHAATGELRSALDALRDSEARYRRIIESLGERFIFYSHDASLRFRFISPSYRRLPGVTDHESLLLRLRESLALSDNATARERLKELQAGRRPAPFDVLLPQPDGEHLVLEVHAVPVMGESGRVLSIEGVARDVTDERRNARLVSEAREALLEAEKMAALGAMVAGVSHELATPLGIGVTAASHLEDLCREGTEQLHDGRLTRSGLEALLESMNLAAGAVSANLGRAADLIQNFKQVAVDQSRVQERDFDLAAYLDEIVLSLRPRFKGTAHRLLVDCPPGLVLHGDPGALYRVVTNLVVNSLEHGFEGLLTGTIRIAAARSAAGIMVDYRDDGCGMSREQRRRLYEPFYTTKRNRGGTGLGMHIVWSNVRHALRGSITCTSAPGKGTRFSLLLPQTTEAPRV